MSDSNQTRGTTASGVPILHGADPRVRKVAQMMADTLEAMLDLDQSSIVATDVLFMLMRDALWCRDNYHGVGNPKLSPELRAFRIGEAKRQILDIDRFHDLSDRYTSHTDSIGKGKG